jgi:hypothetical protein
MSHTWRQAWLALPGVGASLFPKLACPLCWPAYAGLLSSVGLGFPHICHISASFYCRIPCSRIGRNGIQGEQPVPLRVSFRANLGGSLSPTKSGKLPRLL